MVILIIKNLVSKFFAHIFKLHKVIITGAFIDFAGIKTISGNVIVIASLLDNQTLALSRRVYGNKTRSG